MKSGCLYTTTTNASLAGARLPGSESLWQEMLLANARNVGLRPVRVSARAKTWDWLDHLGELEAPGLSGLAA